MVRTSSEIRSEMKAIEQSLDVRVYISMRQLSLSLYVFKENHLLFKEHLESQNNIGLLFNTDIFKSQSLKWEYSLIEQKTYQLFLNFVASAQALVDHTRNIADTLYVNTNFHWEYKEKVKKDLAIIPVRKFIQDLRSYILHNRFPSVSPQLTLGSTSSIRLTLSKQELLKSDKWTTPSRNYLQAQSDRIFLDVLINEYYLLIENFYQWLNVRQCEMHKARYLLLIEQWEKLYQELKETAIL